MGLKCTNAFLEVRIILLVTLSLLITAPGYAQQAKPERQSKAAKPEQAAQSAQPRKDSAESDSEGTEPAKPEEKAFKGMKYRLIGPFRGGRSLTAAGIPGDPTSYCFGRAGPAHLVGHDQRGAGQRLVPLRWRGKYVEAPGRARIAQRRVRKNRDCRGRQFRPRLCVDRSAQ